MALSSSRLRLWRYSRPTRDGRWRQRSCLVPRGNRKAGRLESGMAWDHIKETIQRAKEAKARAIAMRKQSLRIRKRCKAAREEMESLRRKIKQGRAYLVIYKSI
jgi:hypothetical protein